MQTSPYDIVEGLANAIAKNGNQIPDLGLLLRSYERGDFPYNFVNFMKEYIRMKTGSLITIGMECGLFGSSMFT
jgi:hypothetical protein